MTKDIIVKTEGETAIIKAISSDKDPREIMIRHGFDPDADDWSVELCGEDRIEEIEDRIEEIRDETQ